MQQKCLFFGGEQIGFARVGAVASEGASQGAWWELSMYAVRPHEPAPRGEGTRAVCSVMRVFSSLANAKSAAIILAALALITVLIIAAAYRSAIDDIDSLQRELARDYAARTRVWVTGAARTMVAAAETAQYAGQDKTQCDELLREATAADPGYQGIRIDFGDGRVCARAKNSDLAGLLEGVSRDLEAKPRIDVAPNLALAAGNVHSGAENFLAIQIDAPATSDIKGKATALIDARALSLAIGLSNTEGAAAALMSHGQEVSGEGEAGSSASGWLPADAAKAADEAKVGSDYQVATARSRAGATFSYVIQPVLGAELYLLIQSDNAARTAAQWRFLALAACDAAACGPGRRACPRDSSRLLAVDRCDQGGDARKKGRKGAGACARRWRYAGKAARARRRLQ